MEPGNEEQPRRKESESGDRLRGGQSRTWLLVVAAALVLAVLVVVIVLLLRSLGDSISGTSMVRDSIDAGSKPHVRLKNGRGQIRIKGVNGLGSVEYEATRYGQGQDPASAKQRASEVSVNVSREGSTFNIETKGGRNTGADYTLRVPAGGSVEVQSEAGDVDVTGFSGNVDVRADAGDVTIKEVGGSVGVEAPQGDVDIEGVSTDTGEANLEVGTGDVTLRDLVVGTLEAGVEAGDVELLGRFSGGGRVSVETGDIRASIPTEDTRDLTLEADVGEVVRKDGGSKAGNSGDRQDKKSGSNSESP